MKRYLAYMILSILPLSATPENPLIPETWFQNLTATDGSTQQCIIFTTIPGVEYTFFHSQNLKDWTVDGETYGLGQEFAAAMHETAPAPPPPDPANPPAGQTVPVNASITIQPSSGTAGGTVVSWTSLDHGNALRALIPGNAVPAWQLDPFIAAIHGGYQFFIQYIADATVPPESVPPLDADDAAMIADLEAGWAEINTAAAIAAAANCNTPTPSEEGAKGFWRIKADWSLDSDNDGSPDHLEFALAAQAPGAGGLAGNAFNADTNNDGVPDGEQLDADGDSIPDARDIAPDDSGVAYTIVSLPRYAMFTFADTANGAFAINDRGTVLFPNKVWKAGGFQNLITDQSQIPGYTHPSFAGPDISARAINDNDQIIGSGTRFMPGGADPWYFDVIFYWSSPQAVPAFASLTAGSITTYAELRDGRHVRHLDNAGNFFTPSFTWDEALGAGPPGEDAGWKKWTLPAGAAPFVAAPAAEFTQGTSPGGIVWGSEYDGGFGPWLESRITSPSASEIPIEPRDIIQQTQGGPGILAATTGDTNASTVVRKDGVWRISPLLESALDIAADGTAIRKATAVGLPPEPILLNGKWTSLDRAVPGIPASWKTSPVVALSDTSPGGWILAQDKVTLSADNAAALLPLRFRGLDSGSMPADVSVGVDDFSIGSSSPDESPLGAQTMPVQDRIWIMAPLGGPSKTVVLTAPLHADARLKINATGILFGGQEEAVRAATNTTLQISAAQSIASGSESLANFWINDGTYDTPSASKPVGFKIMKARTVNVTVFKIAEELTPGGSVFLPEHMPDEGKLESYLNDVYGPQINVTFNVYVEPVLMTTPIDSDANGLFDSGGAGHSPDQAVLSTLAGPGIEGTHIRIFMLGTHKVIGETGIGTASTDNNTCWVKALSLISGTDPDVAKARVCATTAHEIGHLLFGAGHPNREGKGNLGVAPLPGTNHSKRLMRDGNNNARGHDHLIVKAEWDKAEEWLEDVIDRPETP